MSTRRVSLRQQLAWANALLVLGVVTLSSLAAWFTTRSFILRSLEDELNREADRITRGPRRPDRMGPPGGEGPPRQNTNPDRPLWFSADGASLEGEGAPLDAAALRRAATEGRALATFSNTTLVLYARGPNGILQVQRPLGPVQGFLQTQAIALASLLPLSLILAGLSGYALSRRALRPIDRQASAVESLDGLDPSVRLADPPEIELGRWTDQFNALLGRFERVSQQREALLQEARAAKEAQARFLADASHELRTPLSRLRLATGVGKEPNIATDELRENLLIADEAGRELQSIVEELTTLIQSDAQQLVRGSGPANLAEVVQRAIRSTDGVGGPTPVMSGIDADQVAMNPDHLHRILQNLLANARRHTPLEGTITISCEGSALVVRDSGPGVAAGDLARLGERFYRPDAARSREHGGMGLGLAIVRTLVELYGGELSFSNQNGLVVQMSLPPEIWIKN